MPLAQGHTAPCTYLEYPASSTRFIFISLQREEAFSSKQEYGFLSVETVSFEARDLSGWQNSGPLGQQSSACLPSQLAPSLEQTSRAGLGGGEHEEGLQCSPLSSPSTLPAALLVSGIFWNTEQTLQC